MAQAIVDPAELRRFAQKLRKFSSELEGQLAGLSAQMKNLSATWRDQEQEKYAEEFDVTMKAIARFAESTKEHVPFLMRKAARAEEYLQQR